MQINKITSNLYENINPSSANFLEGALVINFIAGMCGRSSGSLFPIILKAMRLNIREAIATSLFTAIITTS